MIYEKEKRYIIPFDDVPSPRIEMPEISVEGKISLKLKPVSRKKRQLKKPNDA